jgi:hypothetical protein
LDLISIESPAMAGMETNTVSDSFLERILNSEEASITEEIPS